MQEERPQDFNAAMRAALSFPVPSKPRNGIGRCAEPPDARACDVEHGGEDEDSVPAEAARGRPRGEERRHQGCDNPRDVRHLDAVDRY